MKTTLAMCAALIGTTISSAASADSIDPKRLSEIVRVLASDEFEGRSPGTEGETKTVDLRGAAQDVELFHSIASELANSRRWPQWRADSEFHSIRERSNRER